MSIRLALVQHGDYRDALKHRASGRAEPYAGMYESLRRIEELVLGTTYRIINLDAPPYKEPLGDDGELVGFSHPRWKKGYVIPWSWMAYRAVREFQPTHILLRTGGSLSTPILRYAVARNLDVMVMLAGYVHNVTPRERWFNRRYARLLNHPCVYKVGNHRKPASDSLIDIGVDPAKVVPVEVPFRYQPTERPSRALDLADGLSIAYVGGLGEGKGVGDILEAVILLHREGTPARLTLCGDGPMMATLRDRARELPEGAVTFLGRVGGDVAFREMRRATFVCVASRKGSFEGMPLVVTEGFSARTPLLCSDHECLTGILQDGVGLRYFPSGNARALADLALEVSRDPEQYRRLSEATQAAWEKVIVPTQVFDPILEWKDQWPRARIRGGVRQPANDQPSPATT